MNWACVQASGVAENVGVPGTKPSVPAGGCRSQTCSGSMAPGPAARAIVASCARAAPDVAGGDLVLAALAVEQRPRRGRG